MIDLDAALIELSADLDVEGIDVRAHVRRRIAEARRPWRARVIGGLLAALIGLGLVPGVRTAVADFLGLPGVRIEAGDGEADAPPRTSFGEPTTLTAAGRRLGFTVAVPRALGYLHPDGVFIDGSIVTLAYDSGVYLQQFRGEDVSIVKRAVTETLEVTTVAGADAYWVPGRHELTVSGGEPVTVDSVLLWFRDGITYRLESNLSEAEAVRLAGTVR